MISFFRLLKIVFGAIFIGTGLYGKFVYDPEGDVRIIIFILFVGLASIGMGLIDEKKFKKKKGEERPEVSEVAEKKKTGVKTEIKKEEKIEASKEEKTEKTTAKEEAKEKEQPPTLEEIKAKLRS
ncbi:MAG TPA: hypothetical protein VI894_00265 [Candidatus Nanoarchaeia archaeon]|nr:hypothetical protein [Candidatus Nanoarchaeia archaeon]